MTPREGPCHLQARVSFIQGMSVMHLLSARLCTGTQGTCTLDMAQFSRGSKVQPSIMIA